MVSVLCFEFVVSFFLKRLQKIDGDKVIDSQIERGGIIPKERYNICSVTPGGMNNMEPNERMKYTDGKNPVFREIMFRADRWEKRTGREPGPSDA